MCWGMASGSEDEAGGVAEPLWADWQLLSKQSRVAAMVSVRIMQGKTNSLASELTKC